jgi:cytochrome P450
MSQVTVAGQQVPNCPFDHHDHSMRGPEPYEIYGHLREEGIGWSPTYGGFWLVSRHADARAVLKDHEICRSGQEVLMPALPFRNLALEQDPPADTPFRKLYECSIPTGRAA